MHAVWDWSKGEWVVRDERGWIVFQSWSLFAAARFANAREATE